MPKRSSPTITVVNGIAVEVTHKRIKSFRLAVHPPDGRVSVSAPHWFTNTQVQLAISQKLPWIIRKQQEVTARSEATRFDAVTGETIHIWGIQAPLQVSYRPGRAHLVFDGEKLALSVPPGTDTEKRKALLQRWYRQQLHNQLPVLITKWEQRIGVTVPQWSTRQMKSRWGSCNTRTRHIRFNTELAKRDPKMLEYVVVHEMVHYFEHNHGPGFTQRMDRYLPDWRERRKELNTPLD